MGLVMGLNGNGDSHGGETDQLLREYLRNPNAQFNHNNFAIVLVSVDICPFQSVGDQVDVQVTTLGDAKSLTGGRLLLTALYLLRDSEGRPKTIYAIAHGDVIANGDVLTENLYGTIPGGATVKKQPEQPMNK